MAGQDGQAGQRRPGSAVTAKASNLDALPRPGPFQNRLERLEEGFGVRWQAEVRPIDMVIGPWRLPAGIEVQAIVRLAGAGVRGGRVIRRRGQLRAVGQHHRAQVAMSLDHGTMLIS